jgi:hypothetical protein
MKTKTAKVLPKTAGEIANGGLYLQRVRCGKQNCKCARGETHPAYYFFTRRAGKFVKIYVRRSEFGEFARLVVQAATKIKERQQTAKVNSDLLRQLRRALRERESQIKSLKGE